jgi:spermidine synthase
VIGLGSGALACAAQPGENWRFYEIDPVVVKIARDPAHFSYMSSCQPNAPTIIGDARLTVAKEPAGLFDYLLVDAFSSDTIPVHLLTREAVAMYLDRVAGNGLLVMHISNRFLDLAPVIEAAVAGMEGVHGVTITDLRNDPTYDSTSSRVVVISKSASALEDISGFSGVEPFGKPAVAAWTDDFSNIVGALIRNVMQ